MPPDTPPERPTWRPVQADPHADTWVHDGDQLPVSPAAAEGGERYDETGVLGRGGIAEVRSALDVRLGREVAVKRLQHLDSRIGRHRFQREARITAQLEHPGIVPVYDADVDEDGVPYYTMKYVRGTALATALHHAKGLEGRMQLLPAFGAVCQAMAYAHDRRVIHRDLKPDNVMLGEFGEALVVDWGLARALDDDDEPTAEGPAAEASPRPVSIDDASLTVIGQIAGTPAYMAPEQARGEATSPATDVFALGAILYQVLTGSPPHGVADDLHEQLARARTGRIVPVLTRSPFAPPDLAAIAERCLAHDPDRRYPSAAELARDVERWSNGRLVEAYRYSPLEQIRRLASLYWLPIGMGVAGLVAVFVVGSIGLVRTQAEADRAQRNEAAALASARKAERDLSTMLSERALRALEGGDGAAARALAAASLARWESPLARGRLADAWLRPGLTPLWTRRAPHPCEALTTASGRLYCGGEGQVSALDADGTVAWTTPLPVETVSHLAVDGDRLWVGTMEGVVLLGADGALRDHGSGGFVVAMLPTGAGGVRSSQWTSEERLLVDWHPPDAPVRSTYTASSVMDLHRRDGREVRLHAAGYLTQDDGARRIGQVDHVAYAMAPVTDGWLVGGSDTTWLAADGTQTPIDPLSGSFANLQSNDRDQVAGVTAAHDVLVYDLPARQLVASLPTEGDGVRPGLALDGDVLVVAHGDVLRGWRLPGLTATSIPWKVAQERPDGGARLYCAHGGRAELHDLVLGTVTLLEGPASGDAAITACTFLDGQPVAAWSGQTVRWDEEGRATAIDTPFEVVTDLVRVGGELVVEGHHGVMAGTTRLGTGLLRVEADGTVAVQDVETSVVRWSRPGPNGWTTVHEQPLEHANIQALTTLPGRRVAEAPRLAEDEASRIVGPDGTTRMPPHPTKLTAALALDERWLVTGDQSGTLRLWDLETDSLRAQVHAHDARVVDIYATGDGPGKRVVSESFDQSLHAWSVPMLHLPQEEVADAVRRRDGLAFRDGEVHHVDPGL